MPPLERTDCKQDALYWERTGWDREVNPVTADPVALKVRWVNKRREVIDRHGNTIALDATAVVKQEVADGSLMWLGTLAEWQGTGSGLVENQLMQVVWFDSATDIKHRVAAGHVRRTVGLMRFRDAVP